MPNTVQVRTANAAAKYDVLISNGGLLNARDFVSNIFSGTPRKIAIISNKKVFALYGKDLERILSSRQCTVVVHLVGDGERFKDLKTFGSTLNFLAENKLSRTDCVIALGGGVVGDLAGFAASTYLRGVPFIQMPTTLLAMIDSSVGGKTGINSEYGKNLFGTFYQPKGVLIDASTLTTLPGGEITSGFCEAIKQGILAGHSLFNKTASIIGVYHFGDKFDEFLAEQIKFKAKIVHGDPNEEASRTDPRSRKTLNLGHTFAHALEKATDYKYLKHGEAVGHGIIFAAELSKKLGLLDEKVVNLLCDVVHRSGRLPSIGNINPQSITDALSYDKKYISGQLQWILLEGVGKPIIIPQSEIDTRLVRKTILEIASN